MPFSSWDSPPKTLVLSNNAVHVWRASLHVSASALRTLEDTLAVDERARAERFYFQKHREHFIAGRGLLRNILSRYLDKEPAQLRFRYNSYGKPDLTEETGAEGFCFNLSHSHEIALFTPSLAGGRSGLISSIFVLMLKLRNLPNDSSHHERRLCSVHSLNTCGKKGFLTAGRARKLISRRKGKGCLFL